MAEFDPLAAVKAQNTLNLQQTNDNNALSRLIAQGGIQDLLARRAAGDTLNQLNVQGTNAIKDSLVRGGVPFAGLEEIAPKASEVMDQLRRLKIMEGASKAADEFGRAGIGFNFTPGKSIPADLLNTTLLPITPTGTQAAAATGQEAAKISNSLTEESIPNPLNPNRPDTVFKKTKKTDQMVSTKGQGKSNDPVEAAAKTRKVSDALLQNLGRNMRVKIGRDGIQYATFNIGGQEIKAPLEELLKNE